MKRWVLGTLGVAALVASFLVSVSPKPAQAAEPNDQVVINVSGSLSAMSSNPSFRPAFSPSTHDYAIHCQSGVNIVTFSFGGVAPATVQVSLGENQAAVVNASNGQPAQQYWVRCLPHDFPVMQISGSATSVPGWYLTGNIGGPAPPYGIVLDSNGTPVWYQKVPGAAVDLQAVGPDTLAWMPLNGPGVGADPTVGYTFYNLDTQSVQTLKAPILPTDFHELDPLANGHFMMLGSPLVHLATPFNGISNVIDCVVQEVAGDGSLVWSWRASDHLAYGVHAQSSMVNGELALDAYHCNSLDGDSTTGRVLVSVRNTSAVYLIDQATSTIVWKLNGCGSTAPDPDHEPVLALQGDPEGCFDAQHDARMQPNGDISLYDDQSYQPAGSARGVEYAINTQTSKASFVQQFPASLSGPPAQATGSFRRYSGGTDNLVGWGIRPGTGSGFTEMDGNGKAFFSMTFPKGDSEYRVVKVPLGTLNINSMRASAGLPRPTFPTVRWGTLGGVLTSKPGVAAWSSNRLDAFVRGADGQLWHRWWDGTTWRGWEPLGGLLYPGTGPGVAAWGPGRLDVFVTGSDRQLWHKWFDGHNWSGWEPLGGLLLAGPAAASWANGRLDVVVEGTDHAVWHKWYDGHFWSGWETLGGLTTADPGIASPTAGRVDVFVEGTDNQLWHKWFDTSGWHSWQPLAGNLTSGPSATSPGSGLIDVIAAGTAGEPERLPYHAGWGVWQPLLGLTRQPPSVVPFGGGEDVFVTGTDNALWFGSVSPTGVTSTSAALPAGPLGSQKSAASL
jgi:hypothetical protein